MMLQHYFRRSAAAEAIPPWHPGTRPGSKGSISRDGDWIREDVAAPRGFHLRGIPRCNPSTSCITLRRTTCVWTSFSGVPRKCSTRSTFSHTCGPGFEPSSRRARRLSSIRYNNPATRRHGHLARGGPLADWRPRPHGRGNSPVEHDELERQADLITLRSTLQRFELPGRENSRLVSRRAP